MALNIEDVEHQLREMRELLAVFRNEYNIPEDAFNQMMQKIERVAEQVALLKC